MSLSGNNFGKFKMAPEPIVRRKIDRASTKTRILDRIINSPRGVTADDLELRLGLKSSSVSARLNEMLKAGMIVVGDEYRKTRSGRPARVYFRRLPTRK